VRFAHALNSIDVQRCDTAVAALEVTNAVMLSRKMERKNE
jgi:hypothetical protein